MRRRHLRGVMAIERQVYPRPWSPNLFVAEMTETANRCYLVARIDRAVVGYAGLICYGDEAHVAQIVTRRVSDRITVEEPIDLVEISLEQERVRNALDRLPERERQVMEMRFGFTGREAVSLEEIGRELGVTRQRVRQLETSAFARLEQILGTQPLPTDEALASVA
jgi:RNA polymerase sigma factor (sigma-70 family)